MHQGNYSTCPDMCVADSNAVDALGHLQLALRRLDAQLSHIRGGDPLAVLELATIMNLLVGDGKGQQLLVRGFKAANLDLSTLALPGFQGEKLPTRIRGRSAKLIVRPSYEDWGRGDVPNSPDCAIPRMVPLKKFVRQERLRSNGLWAQDFNLNLLNIIDRMRNRLAAHADDADLEPWFEDTRFYVGGLDVLGLILWSAGEALIEATVTALTTGGVATPPYIRHRDIDGLEIGQIEFFDDLNATIFMKIIEPRPYPRPVLGMAAKGREFMMGVGPSDDNGESPIRMMLGRDFEVMQGLHTRFVADVGAADQIESKPMKPGWSRLDFRYEWPRS